MTDQDKEPSGALGVLQKTASVGTLVKTVLGLIVGFAAGSIAVYQHFAKTAELHALQCSVIDQGAINNQMIRTAQEVRQALNSLRQSLDSPKDNTNSTKSLADELSKAISNIESALSKIEDTRAKTQADSIKGERKC